MELHDIKIKNFGSYVDATVKLSNQGLVWVGGVNKDTEAANSNGSGKSTVFKALTWGLYGETVDGVKGDKVIHDGAKMAEVTIRLSEGKRYWTITRGRTKGSPKLSLSNPLGKEVEGSKDVIQSEITELLGLDFKAFRNSVLYGQNDTLRFANPSTKDAERKSMLHKIMRTDILSHCHEAAKKIARDVKGELVQLENELQTQVVILGECDIDDMEDDSAKWEAEKERAIQEHIGDARDAKQEAVELLATADDDCEVPDVESIQSKIDTLQKKADKHVGVDIDVLFEALQDSNEALSGARINVEKQIDSVERLSEQLERLDGDNCSLCTAPLKTGSPKKLITGLAKQLESAQAAAAVARELEKAAKIDKNEKQKAYEKERENRAEYDALVRRIARIKTTELHAARLEIVKAEQRADNIRREAKVLLDSARNSVALSKKEKQKENPYAERLAKAKTKAKKIKSTMKKLQRKIDDKTAELAHTEFWSKGFSNRGLPSYILDAVMPFLTDRANEYLDVLADGDISLEFSTQRELKSSKGALRDEIEIRWCIEGNDGYPPSGGQLKKIEIATDLALMDLVAEREGSHLDLLMLDEVLDGLDEEGCARVYTLLQSLRSRRGSIFVISHEGKVGDIFEKAIFAVKEDGVTSLEV